MPPATTPFLQGALSWLYGAPPPACPECGYRWSIEPDEARALIARSPEQFEAALAGHDGMARPADGSWNATAYVWHLSDLARSWAERWVQIRHSPGSRLIGWDPDELADVRGYRELDTEAGIWALRSAVSDLIATTEALEPDTAFEHGDWGRGTVADGMRWLGHEFHHHLGDVRRRTRA